MFKFWELKYIEFEYNWIDWLEDSIIECHCDEQEAQDSSDDAK
jgi:hypothetical protein